MVRLALKTPAREMNDTRDGAFVTRVTRSRGEEQLTISVRPASKRQACLYLAEQLEICCCLLAPDH